MIPYGKQNIDADDIDAVVSVLKSSHLTQGPQIELFEQAFAKYVGAQYALAVTNGTAGLHLSALALGIKPGDTVITSPITFAATANCIRYCGGTVAFCDIDPKTYTMDVNYLKKMLESAPPNTYKAVIPIDYAGHPCDIIKIKDLCTVHNLALIEDACHAPGAYALNKSNQKEYCGNGVYADLTVFSFHPVKHIACGEGGMVTTNNKILYDKVCSLRSHGITKSPEKLLENHGGWYYEMHELGYNYRLTDIQAALGISQLKKAHANVTRRNEIAVRYNIGFKGCDIIIPFIQNDWQHAFHLYVIQVKNRKKLYDHLHDHDILAQVHYIPVHTLPYYRDQSQVSMPESEKFYSQCLSLPMFPSLTNHEVDFIIEKVCQYLKT
ncbi:MAG: UDP-4-amino-4,6-dideoxy-N-acetyl-beta-L-altrosamine transaminase [Fibrobacterales bacterium]